MESVFNFVRDQSWGFGGVVITILIFVAGYFLQRVKKSLSFRVLNKSSLLTTNNKFRNKIKIFYSDKPVDDIHFINLEFVNDGNIPIEPGDFKKDLLIKPHGKYFILNMEISAARPTNLDVELDTNDEGYLSNLCSLTKKMHLK